VLRSVRIAKRAIDVLGGAVGLALSAPLLPIIAAAIYIDSPGPVFFRQRRAGSLRAVKTENGKKQFQFDEFEMHKFRTMVPNAEAKTGIVVAGANDARITRVGKFLRKSRLDELPQFWDVLRGKMSLVGPRPERPEVAMAFGAQLARYQDRHRVRSGITGWAQVSGLRGQTSLAERVDMDNYYIRNWSLSLDLKIAFLTVPAVLRTGNDA
jgi:lipopolysaccharide/colanic/teichoic acid biosynthesis glycosyltransferase